MVSVFQNVTLASTSDDAAFLEAVEALLQDDDLLVEDETSSASSGSSGEDKPTVSDARPPDGCVKLKRPPMMNRSRMRMRMEVLSLREQVVALEAELETAKRGNSKPGRPNPSSAAAWKALVKCQSERLRASERERVELRLRVRECKRVIRRLHRYIRALKISAIDMDLRHNIRIIECANSGIPAEFGATSAQLDWMYRIRDAVMSGRPFDSLDDDSFDRRILFDRTPKMSVEVSASRLLPFSSKREMVLPHSRTDATGTAVWQHHLTKTKKLTATVVENRIDASDCIRRSFFATFSFPKFKGSGRGQMETRRIVEGDRVLILQYTLHTLLGGDVQTEGVGIRICNWTVIQPPRNQLCNTSKSICQVTVFERRELVFSGPEAVREGASFRDEIRRFSVDTADYVLGVERHDVEHNLLTAH